MVGESTSLEFDGVRVRPATAKDIDTVTELRLALLREYHDHPIYGRLRSDADDRAAAVFAPQLAGEDQIIFLAEQDHEAIGIVRCADVKGSPLLHPDRYCYVTSVYVCPEHRRRGVLSLLMTHAEEWARARGLTEMRLHNSTLHPMARSAWDQLGFEVNEEVRLKRIR